MQANFLVLLFTITVYYSILKNVMISNYII